MIVITDPPKPPSGSPPPTQPPGGTVVLMGVSGPPISCKTTVGVTTNTYRVPADIPLTYTPDGKWSISVQLPNTTGQCTVTVDSQSEKEDSRVFTLQGPIPGGGGQQDVTPVVPIPLDDED